MTPQYILTKSLVRDPHCFSAHVPGRGYINRGELESERPDFLRQYWRTALADISNLGYAPAYAEPGYEQPERGILLANWNHFPTVVEKLLERAGYAVEWEDEWSTCDGCGKAVRTEPDGYSWEPSFKIVDDSTLLCTACAADELEDADEVQS